MEKQSISVPKRAIVSGRLLDKRLPNNTVADAGNIKPKTRKSKSSNKTKNRYKKQTVLENPKRIKFQVNQELKNKFLLKMYQ